MRDNKIELKENENDYHNYFQENDEHTLRNTDVCEILEQVFHTIQNVDDIIDTIVESPQDTLVDKSHLLLFEMKIIKRRMKFVLQKVQKSIYYTKPPNNNFSYIYSLTGKCPKCEKKLVKTDPYNFENGKYINCYDPCPCDT